MASESSFATLNELLADRAAKRRDEPCLLFGDRAWTYLEFAEQVENVARAFQAAGLRAGDKVALLLPNCPHFLFAVFAMARIGGVFVPLNSAQTADEVKYILLHSEARYLLTADAFVPLVNAVWRDVKGLEVVICIAAAERKGMRSWAEFLESGASRLEPAAAGPEDLASITYTSGTTDCPKGVMLKQLAFAFAPNQRARALGWTADDRVLVVLPLFHVNALCHMCIAMMSVGGVVVLRDKFSASRFWDDVKAYGVTTSSIMQTIPRILLNSPPRPDDAATPLRQVVALLPPDVHLEFERRFGVTAIPSYSLTEDLLSVLGPLDTRKRKLGSCGVAIAPDVHRLRIASDADETCAPGELGEITKRSPTVMMGYYKNADATASALKNGWLHTGDIGYLDEDGFLYFVDRKKDMIKRGGENISSEEVERVLNSHPLIAESAVVAVPDPIRQEEVKACIVLREGGSAGTLPPEELWDFCARHLAAFKIPRYLEYRQALPKTPSSKVQKNILREEGLRSAVFDRGRLQQALEKPASPG